MGYDQNYFNHSTEKYLMHFTLNNMLMRSENCGLIGIESLEKYK
jgi:hypothetical protein